MKQMKHEKGSFQAKKVKNDKPLPAYAHADAVNSEMERPMRFNEDKRRFDKSY